MIKIISPSTRVHVESYAQVYEYNNFKGAGFSFACDKNGMVLTDELHAEALANWLLCVEGRYDVHYVGIADYSYNYTEYAVGSCSCGRAVALYGSENYCACGRVYSMTGQELALGAGRADYDNEI